MKQRHESSSADGKMSRRGFVQAGGGAVMGGALSFPLLQGNRPQAEEEQPKEPPRIREHRTLGRTGFRVSDIAMGGTRNGDSTVVRYAYDQGINYFDTAEGYMRGSSETIIGEALKHMDRKKVFITTKIHLSEQDTEETVRDRFEKCLGRLKTEYVDAFFMHGPSDVATVKHEGFHAATKKLKADGRLRHVGVSSHGSRWGQRGGMEEVLGAAAEDGRFDVMLLVYNFMNREPGEKVLAACKEKNIGTTAMKTAPGVLAVEPIDPENLTEDQLSSVKRMEERGMSREAAIERLQRGAEREKESVEKTRPFAEKYKIRTKDQLRRTSVQWVLENPDMHTACVSFADFDLVDKILAISGKRLAKADHEFLRDYRYAFERQYCRHACDGCAGRCPERLPVSSIMRYAYYFQEQGREKFAMAKYAALGGRDASHCEDCDAPCDEACPFGVSIQGQLRRAHSLLTLA
jgi:predicted aldo/keto reductase-like oxidoreductase